jgi:hypothetical protein
MAAIEPMISETATGKILRLAFPNGEGGGSLLRIGVIL